MISIITRINGWFQRAKPEPVERDFQVQLGVHFEEVQEMVATLSSSNSAVDELLLGLNEQLLTLARKLKQMDDAGISLGNNRVDFLDSICDQIVTGTGCGYFAKMQVDAALEYVNASNYSKFVNGKPMFDENGKIAKGPDYYEPDLVRFV